MIAFLSPMGFKKFKFGCRLSSSNADDDGIGIVVAQNYVDGVNHMICAARTGGGIYNANFTIFYTNTGIGPTTYITSTNVGANGGWSGRYTDIESERDGNQFTVRCSTFNSSAKNTVLTFSLNDYPAFRSFFEEGGNFGFFAHSQAAASFSNMEFEFPPADYKDASGIATFDPGLAMVEVPVTVLGRDGSPVRHLQIVIYNPLNGKTIKEAGTLTF